MWVSINNTISQISNLVDVDVSPLSNWDALIYVSATWDWTATALPWGWDMLKATYDTDLDWVVDTAHDVSATPLITRSSVASQWGLLINIDSATGDIARTTSGFIEDEKYWVSTAPFTSTLSAKFTSSTPYWFSGRLCAYTNVTVVPAASYCRPIEINYLKAVWTFKSPVKPSTKYIIKMKVYTNITYTSWAGIRVICSTYTAADAYVTDVTVATITTSWNSIYTKEFTTWATVWLLSQIYVRYDSWIVGESAIDINSMTLEEVVEPVANSLTSSSPSLVSFTAVGSTGNIDQSFTTGTASWNSIWNIGGLSYMGAQTFTPWKVKHASVILYKKTSTWTPTGDLKIDVRTTSAGDPTATILATYTMPLATYNALWVWEFTVNLPCNLTVWTLYAYVISDTVVEALWNAFTIAWHAAWWYTGGDNRYSTDWGTVWVVWWTTDLYFKTLYYRPTTNFKASQNNSTVSISADEDGFLNWSIINLSTGIASFTETFGTYYILDYTISGSDLIAEINLPWDSISASFTSDKSLTYSSDWATYGTTFPVGYKKIWVKILAYSGVTSFSYSIKFDNSLVTLRNYPTNKDVVIAYNMSLATATTTATYRATLYGFPAIEYATGVYQYLNIDTTATGSVVSFSSDGSSYTVVADGANIALSSTVNPLVWVKHNITANRLYLSSNDYNASSDKDGSNKMTVVYDVTSQWLTYTVDELLSEVNELKAAVYALQNP